MFGFKTAWELLIPEKTPIGATSKRQRLGLD